MINCIRCNKELTLKNWRPRDIKKHNRVCRDCYKKEDEQKRRKIGILPRKRKLICRICKIKLGDDNWWESNQKNWNNICIECHKKEISDYQRTQSGKNNHLKACRKYNKTLNGKISISKQNKKTSSKRRKLGSCFLNNPFNCSEGHHIDFENIIHIPKEWNHIIPHNVYTGYNMEIVNTYAYFFLMMQNIGELDNMFNINKVI